MELFEMPETEKVLWELAAAVKEDYKRRLTTSQHIASKNLVNSVTGGKTTSAATIAKRAATNALSSVLRSGTSSILRGLFGNKK